jgi:hypothetical protein
MGEIQEPHVGLRVLAIGDDAAIGDLTDQDLHHRMVRAHHGEAIERHVVNEGAEGALHGIERHEMIEMLGIDVGHDGNVGRQLEKGAVGFIGLDHHPVAGTEPRIGAVGVDDTAIDDRRIEAAGIDQRSNERCRGGLAVRPGDGDATLEPHQLGQHLCAPHDRQPFGARSRELRIIALDRSRHHHHRGIAERAGGMAD